MSERRAVQPDADALASFVPHSLLRRYPAGALAPTEAAEISFEGAVLFSDLVGFTPLAERLTAAGPSGVERLSELLNRFFGELVDCVLDHGGDILSFNGDGLAAVWPADAVHRLDASTLAAAACGLEIRRRLHERDLGEGERLTLRTGIGAGALTGCEVGDPGLRRLYMVLGEPVDSLGDALAAALPGQLLLAPAAWRQVASRCEGSAHASGFVELSAMASPPEPIVLAPPPAAEPSCVSPFVSAVMRERLAAGQGAWLAELRRVSVLFVGIPPQAGAANTASRFDELVRDIQSVVGELEGAVQQLVCDDKGIVCLIAFGLPPTAHENEPVRAVRACLEIRSRLEAREVVASVGVATGRAFCGPVGSERRREYAMVGDCVNLSARLMGASRGNALCDATTQLAAAAHFQFEALPPLALKGKATPIEVYRPVARLRSAQQREAGAFVGRAEERVRLVGAVGALEAGQGGAIVIEGEPGIGKSRLLAELSAFAETRDVPTLLAHSDAIERATPYYAWRRPFAELLGLDQIEDGAARRAAAEAAFSQDAELERLGPLLNAVLSIDLPENEITTELAGEARARSTQDLLLRLLDIHGAGRPLLVFLEDLHWFDAASAALVERIVRRAGPTLVIATKRPFSQGDHDASLMEQTFGAANYEELSLQRFGEAESAELIRRALGATSLEPLLLQAILEKSDGNPFYCEELALAMRDLGLLQLEQGEARLSSEARSQDAPLPDTLQEAVTARIDRLAAAEQLTMKVASVIGRVFPQPAVTAVHPVESDRERVPAHLLRLEDVDITQQRRALPVVEYAFRHIVVQETAYGLMLFAQRRDLHRRAALWLEAESGVDPASVDPLMAHHWAQAGEPGRAIPPLDRAAEAAMRTGSYRDAIRLLEQVFVQLAELPEESGSDPLDRARWNRLLSEAFRNVGEAERAVEYGRRALALIGKPVPRSQLGVAVRILSLVARQVSYRLRPERHLGSSTDPRRDAERASSGDALSKGCFFTNELVTGSVGNLINLNAAERLGPGKTLAEASVSTSFALLLAGLPRAARFYEARASDLMHFIDSGAERADAKVSVGLYHMGLGNWSQAMAANREGMELAEAVGDQRRWCEHASLLGIACLPAGQPREARDWRRRFAEVARDGDDEQLIGWASIEQAETDLFFGDPESAATALEGTENLALRLGDAEAVWLLGLLARARSRLGRSGAVEAAERVLVHSRASNVFASYAYEGMIGAVETMLVASKTEPPGRGSRAARRRLQRGIRELRRFAKIFPIATARLRLLEAECAGATNSAARKKRIAALEAAEALHMPIEAALACAALSRDASISDSEREAYRGRALAAFEGFGAQLSDVDALDGLS